MNVQYVQARLLKRRRWTFFIKPTDRCKYYVGNGYAVEWRSFNYGCVKTRVQDRKWTHWYKLPFIDYGDGASTVAPSTTTVSLGSRLLKKGMTGADVQTLQELLLQLGYSLPKYGADGDFGSETEAAVIAFQKAEGLERDGKYGEKTHAALMDAVADDDAGKAGSDETTLPASSAAVVIEADGGNVNIRVGNGTQYSRITTVGSGTTFEFVATAPSGWNAVVVGSQVGWVSGKYSKVIE